MSHRIATSLTVCALVLVMLAGCDLSELAKKPEIAKLLRSGRTKKAENRVTKILEAINADPRMTSVQYQTAVCSWYSDVMLISQPGQLEIALDGFEAWRDAGGLYTGVDFQIVKSWAVEEASTPTVIVEILLDDQPFFLNVPEGHTISWAWF